VEVLDEHSEPSPDWIAANFFLIVVKPSTTPRSVVRSDHV
jgi:hypothetical protein